MVEVMKKSEYLETGLGITVNAKVAHRLNTETYIINFPAKHIALMEGTKSNSLYFIIRGSVRGYYIDDNGEDITKCFSSENEFFSSEGLRNGQISSFTIECLEECQCIQLSYNLVNELIKEDETLNNIFIKYYLQEVDKLEKRVKNSSLMNAKERYVDFCIQYPKLKDRVELKYIASFIGIRAASLSRIRKGMKK